MQASYALKAPGIAGRVVLGARRSATPRSIPSTSSTATTTNEIGGAFNYYYNRHNLKVQADYRQLEDDAANSGAGTKTKEFRLQTQFIF